jgi:sensor c-di-GMP phosphodiesterase-like protein
VDNEMPHTQKTIIRRQFYRNTMSVVIITGIAIVVALVAIATPTFFAIELARKQGQSEAKKHLIDYATDIVSRSETTANQILQGVEKLERENANNNTPCSSESLAVMQAIDLSSSYIQAIGYVLDDDLLCSSFGQDAGAAPLGPVDIITPRGTKMRAQVRFPFAPDSTFTVIQFHDYAAVIHKDLSVDITIHENNVSLVSFVPAGDMPVLASRGRINPEWFKRLGNNSETVFTNEGYMVAIVKSKTFHVAGLAAMPTAGIDAQVSEISAGLIPIGLGAGVVLALIFFSWHGAR